MTRAALPNRRGADVVSFMHDNRQWTATFGFSQDGHLVEVFLDTDKESAIADAAREAAILASLALQFGAPLRTIQHALSSRDAGPIGAALMLIKPMDEPRAGGQPQ